MPSPRTGYAIVAAMLLLAGGAFLRAEQLKLQLSPVARPLIAQHISPTCSGSKACRRVARHVVQTAQAADGVARDGRRVGPRGAFPPGGRQGRACLRLVEWPHVCRSRRARTAATDCRSIWGRGRRSRRPTAWCVDTVPPVIVLTSAPGAVPVRYTAKGQPRVFLLLAPPSGPASFVRAHGGVARVPAGKQVGGTVMTLVGTDAAR